MMLKSMLRLTAIAGFAVATAAHAQVIELKVSHYLPPNHTVHKVLEDLGQTLETQSAGRLKLRIYPSSQLGPPQRQFDLARNGQADIVVGLPGATPGRYAMSELIGLPFVAPAAGTTSAITSRRITELAPKYLAPEYEGLHLLWVGVAPIGTFYTARREIATVADFAGLKLRFQGEQHAKVLRALGAVPLQVQPGEVADGMSKGVIDGAVFNAEGAESFGLASVTRHVVDPGMMSTVLVMAMNQARYDGLAPDLRAILDAATGVGAAERLGQRWDVAEQQGRETLVANKVGFNTFAPAELAKLRTTLQPLVAEAANMLEKKGRPATQFLADYTK